MDRKRSGTRASLNRTVIDERSVSCGVVWRRGLVTQGRNESVKNRKSFLWRPERFISNAEPEQEEAQYYRQPRQKCKDRFCWALPVPWRIDVCIYAPVHPLHMQLWDAFAVVYSLRLFRCTATVYDCYSFLSFRVPPHTEFYIARTVDYESRKRK